MMFLFLMLPLFSYISSQENADWEHQLKSTGNKDRDEVFFEGDMILPRRSVKQAVDTQEIRRVRIKSSKKKQGVVAAITAPRSWRWRNGVVPYYINPKLRCSGISCIFSGASEEIAAAMKEWSAKTCITFREKKDSDKDFVHFRDSKWGHCAAHIGRIGGEQYVYLGKFCRSKGIVLHEIGHALGFFHEQSRPDRDQYIKIYWKNISKKHWHNFKKYKTGISDMGTPYDYDSIMHYGKRAFKKWYKLFSVTIEKKKPGKKIGQRKYLSKIDVEEMNRYYDCHKKN